jgi:hypothetical protein
MSGNEPAGGAAPGTADACLSNGAAASSTSRHPRQDPPPLEQHFLANDVVVCFQRPRVELIIGVWQGPGCIAQLRREARP